jgi:YcxB-like protein
LDASAGHQATAPLTGPSVSVEYTLTSGDVWGAAIAASRYSTSTNAIGAFLLFTGTLTVILTGDLFSVGIAVFGLLLLSGVLPAVLMNFAIRRRPDLMRRPITVTASPSGIRTETPSTSSVVTWGTYKRVRPLARTYLLEVGTGPIALIPARAFSTEQRASFELLADRADVLDRSSAIRPLGVGVGIGLLGLVIVFAIGVVSANL